MPFSVFTIPLVTCGLVGLLLQAAPPTASTTVHNDQLLRALAEAASYSRVLATHYTRTANPQKAGSGQSLSFTNGSNRFSYFNAGYHIFLTDFTIAQPERMLATVLPLGASKQEILRKVGLVRSQENVHVVGTQENATAHLLFRAGKLYRVTFAANLELD